MMVWWLW